MEAEVTSTDHTTNDPMARALAEIARVFDHEPARMRERMHHDSRMQGLEALILSLATPKPADGFQGGIQIMLEMTSPGHWRQMRAKALKFAREHQIMGHPGSARFWLHKAADHRKEEVCARNREISFRNLEAVDRACAAIAADRLELVA